MTSWKVWLTPLLILLNMACSHSGPGSTKGKDERTGPVFEKLNLFVAGEGGYFCYRVPALVVTTKGTIAILTGGGDVQAETPAGRSVPIYSLRCKCVEGLVRIAR